MPVDNRRRVPDLPGVAEMPRTPQVEMPQGGDMVASRVADFGNIVQNFTSKVSQTVGQQTDLQAKATQMVLKTNIDNSMRAFARSSLAMLNPKEGIKSFHEQADSYIEKLIDGGTGINYQIIQAYANSARDTQLRPLETQLRNQTRIDAKSSILASFNSNSKDLSQIIKSTPYEEAVHFHSFDRDKRADAYAQAPTIAKASYTLSQTLNQIDAAVAGGLFNQKSGDLLKKQIINQSNDEMLNHAYHLALEHGEGQNFVNSFASKMDGEDDFAYYTKHVGKFKQIQDLFLVQHKISENQAKADINNNLNDISLGKASNPFVDSLAEQVAFLEADYPQKKNMREISGGLYTQFTAGTRADAIRQFAKNNELINGLINQTGLTQDQQEKFLTAKNALDLAYKNASNFFSEYERDPVEYINKNSVLADVATNQTMWDRAIAQHKIPASLQIPMNDTLRGKVAYQIDRGGSAESARILSNAEAVRDATDILGASPMDAVAKIQDLHAQYGVFSANVFQDLVKHGGLPEKYGILQGINPNSPFLPEIVTAIKTPSAAYDSGQKSAIAKHVSNIMDFSSGRPQPDAGFVSRLIGTGWESLRAGITGREFDPGQYSSGLLGSPAIYSDKSTTPQVRLKAYFDSLSSSAGFATGQMFNNGKETLNSMINYYTGVMHLDIDEATRRAADAITGHYSFEYYRDNNIRLPRNKTNFNDINGLLTNTDALLNKIKWDAPMQTTDYTRATRADDIGYFLQNIKNGHWATHPSDTGLIWVGASGTIPTQNGKPLYISFDSMKDFDPPKQSFFRGIKPQEGETLAQTYRRANEADQYLALFQKNNVAFNEDAIDLDPRLPKHKLIKDTYSRTELLTRRGAENFEALVEGLFANHAEAVRKKRATE